MMTGMVELTAGGPLLEQGDAIGVGHPDVQQHQIGPLAQAGGAGLGRVFSHLDLVAFVA